MRASTPGAQATPGPRVQSSQRRARDQHPKRAEAAVEKTPHALLHGFVSDSPVGSLSDTGAAAFPRATAPPDRARPRQSRGSL